MTTSSDDAAATRFQDGIALEASVHAISGFSERSLSPTTIRGFIRKVKLFIDSCYWLKNWKKLVLISLKMVPLSIIRVLPQIYASWSSPCWAKQFKPFLCWCRRMREENERSPLCWSPWGMLTMLLIHLLALLVYDSLSVNIDLH